MTSQLSRRARIWIYSIRDAFVSLIPLTLFGVLAVLARNFPLPAFQQFLLGDSGQAFSGILDLIIGGTHGVFGLSLAVVVWPSTCASVCLSASRWTTGHRSWRWACRA